MRELLSLLNVDSTPIGGHEMSAFLDEKVYENSNRTRIVLHIFMENPMNRFLDLFGMFAEQYNRTWDEGIVEFVHDINAIKVTVYNWCDFTNMGFQGFCDEFCEIIDKEELPRKAQFMYHLIIMDALRFFWLFGDRTIVLEK